MDTQNILMSLEIHILDAREFNWTVISLGKQPVISLLKHYLKNDCELSAFIITLSPYSIALENFGRRLL
jgi:hypothetical protein